MARLRMWMAVMPCLAHFCTGPVLSPPIRHRKEQQPPSAAHLAPPPFLPAAAAACAASAAPPASALRAARVAEGTDMRWHKYEAQGGPCQLACKLSMSPVQHSANLTGSRCCCCAAAAADCVLLLLPAPAQPAPQLAHLKRRLAGGRSRLWRLPAQQQPHPAGPTMPPPCRESAASRRSGKGGFCPPG